jgi:hypothetical protein
METSVRSNFDLYTTVTAELSLFERQTQKKDVGDINGDVGDMGESHLSRKMFERDRLILQ